MVFTHLEPTILFSHSPAVSHLKPRDFRLYEPTILFSSLVSGFPHRKFLWWTLDFEPAFSPRFSPTLSPRSFFHTRQRFPISNHVTSGCMSPRSYFPHWSAVSLTGSSSGHVIALDQSEASIRTHTSGLYYSPPILVDGLPESKIADYSSELCPVEKAESDLWHSTRISPRSVPVQPIYQRHARRCIFGHLISVC